MKKQTAVEWFQDQIIKIVNGTCELSETQIFEQAKAMEREQIIEAWIAIDNELQRLAAEQYYNQTYKGGKQ